jgi:hypothetical protein
VSIGAISWEASASNDASRACQPSQAACAIITLAYTDSQNRPSQRTRSRLSGTIDVSDTSGVRMSAANAARSDISAADQLRTSASSGLPHER